ncbi:BgTH12-01550 [Blumeria graminis f. sp. triticale]|uniref:BgTH12-01550 n=1 Tax=Blumeria graminis f. sp. triticale TaxID=1689686 RepID=A0A9W4CZ91_BLUGR|nr:BgTH12-01550 [Blumeria graminis f. sp. triticale]
MNNIIFATSDDVKTSLKEAHRKTEVWTLTERLGNIEKICTIPKLTSSNWNSHFESIKWLISVTETACVFLPVTPSTKAVIIWSAWWATKLKESASHIKINDNETPLFVLTTIVSQTQAAMRSNLIEIINRFWTFQPSNNMSQSKFLVEYERRLNEFKQNNTITLELKRQMKYLLNYKVCLAATGAIRVRQSQTHESRQLRYSCRSVAWRKICI